MKRNLFKMESSIHKYILLFLILLTSVPTSSTSPVRNINHVHGESPTESPSVLGASSLLPFLKRFGYLESGNGNSSDHESDTLYTQESVELAIKEMQKFGGIQQSGLLDNATLTLLTKPRCGLPDVIRNGHGGRRKRYVIGANGWNKRRLTYRIENWAPQLSESSVEAEVRQAFNTWADYASLRFINKPRWNNDDVDISISFGRGYHGDRYPFDGSGGILAHAFFPYGHGSLGGDIHFDLDENWGSSDDNDNSPGEYDASQVKFLAVAIHEIGHSLGLSHSPSQDSVMFPYYQYPEEGQAAKTKLGYDDIMAMYQLYIQRTIEGSSEDDENEPVTPSPSSSTTTTESVPALTSSPTTVTTEITGATVDLDATSTTLAPAINPTTEGNKAIPDICSDGYDSIAFLRNELFVFKNEFMWRFREKAVSDPNYPVESSRLFPMLANVKRIDAAFESVDGKIYFFSGNQYWIYDHNENSHARPLTDFGLSDDVQKIDAAFIWAKNGKLYLFSDNSFWKYNMDSLSLEEGYPKSIERWRGLPHTGINSVLKWSDGRTYFFKNEKFWRFDDTSVHTDEGFPLKTGPFWFGC